MYKDFLKNAKAGEFDVVELSFQLAREAEKIHAKLYSLYLKNLEKGKSIRVIRQITEAWTLEDLGRYEELIDAGSQVRHLSLNEIILRFTVFDEEDIIIVFPPNSKLKSPQTVEALWLRAPSLGKILCELFEVLWKKSQPILPLLRKIKKKKQTFVETKRRRSV